MYTAYYRFGANSNTSVRCVYISCHGNDMCIFTSSEDGAELQVSMLDSSLDSGDKCVVNSVDIVHDCMPRRVDLTLKFTSYAGNDGLYFQVQYH